MPEQTLAGVSFIEDPSAVINPQMVKDIKRFQGDYRFVGGSIKKPAVKITNLGALDNSATLAVSGKGITEAEKNTLLAADITDDAYTLYYYGVTYSVYIDNLQIRKSSLGSSRYDFSAQCSIIATYA